MIWRYDYPMSLNHFSDEELAVLAREDPEIFNGLLLRHTQALTGFVYYKYCRNIQQAEDIVQDAHLKAYLNLHSFDPSRKWRTWLFRIAINTAKSALAKIYWESLEDFHYAAEEDPATLTETIIEKDILRTSLSSLPADYAQILNWHYFQGLEIKDIAEKIKKPVFSVKNRLRFAERLLIQAYYCASLNCSKELPFKT